MNAITLFTALALAAPAATADDPASVVVLAPKAKAQTEKVTSRGDAADDPAVWVHPTDPSKSRVLGTDKKGGLNVYGLDGKRLQTVSDGSRPNNVDVLYDVRVGGRTVDLAFAGSRNKDAPGVKIWVIDRETGDVSEPAAGPTFPVFGGAEPYGSCAYRSPKDGRLYVFVNDHAGHFEQYRLDTSGEKIRAEKVRAFAVGSQAEGCVADHETGRLYVAEEDVGVWEYGAEPADGDARRAVAKVGEHGLKADVEGLTIYDAGNGKGYLIASSQGSNTFLVYDRAGRHDYVATIDPAAGDVDDVDDSDGVDVVSQPLGDRFPKGLMVVQDGSADGGGQNFKLYAWDDVAGSRLTVETGRPARR